MHGRARVAVMFMLKFWPVLHIRLNAAAVFSSLVPLYFLRFSHEAERDTALLFYVLMEAGFVKTLLQKPRGLLLQMYLYPTRVEADRLRKARLLLQSPSPGTSTSSHTYLSNRKQKTWTLVTPTEPQRIRWFAPNRAFTTDNSSVLATVWSHDRPGDGLLESALEMLWQTKPRADLERNTLLKTLVVFC